MPIHFLFSLKNRGDRGAMLSEGVSDLERSVEVTHVFNGLYLLNYSR